MVVDIGAVRAVLRRVLTPDQFSAAIDSNNEVITLACAGSGKSTTLAYRVAWLVATGADPRGIVAFTFTDKAAESMKRQISKAFRECGLDPMAIGAMYVGTVHSYCYYLLSVMDSRYRQVEVLDENRLKLYLMSRRVQLGLHELQNDRGARYFETIKEVSNAWKSLNDEMISIEDIQPYDEILATVLERLSTGLQMDHFIDFSLMVRLAVEAIQNDDQRAEQALEGLRHLMVDEYQDINPSQEQLIKELHQRTQSLFVVGDDDQAIYAWRGADVSNILTFTERYPECDTPHTLAFNFRSTEPIVQASSDFIAAELGPERITKHPTAGSDRNPSDFRNLWFQTRSEEANWVVNRLSSLLGTKYIETSGAIRGLTPGDFAILMRSTRQAEQTGDPYHEAFTSALTTAGIPFTLESGGGVFERPHISALRDVFELLRDGSPNRETVRIMFDSTVLPLFPEASFTELTQVIGNWGRSIHAPIAGSRRRVRPQQMVHEILGALGLGRAPLDAGTMHDLGIFSGMIQDVESVYVSIDTTQRYQEVLNFLWNVAESGYDVSTEEVLRRPDAVVVSTVHKIKGLEFPIVFIVDAEQQRFPLRIRNYSGWLPLPVIQPALNRRAYRGSIQEEARLFYTALTRGESCLYITGSEHLPGGASARKRSSFSQGLSHPRLYTDPDGMPEGLIQHTPIARIDETSVPTTYSEIKSYLNCPADYKMRKTFGFSPPIPEMFGFGMTVHATIGRLHQGFHGRSPTNEEAEELCIDTFHLKHVPQSNDPANHPGPFERARDSASRMVKNYVETYANDFERQHQVEVRFEIPLQMAVITGAIDLILKYSEDGTIEDATVVDFKTMAGGNNPEESPDLDWTELALQVQLYAKAARDVLGENARTGAVHLLKDNQRIDIPVDDPAVDAAIANVEWAVDRILAGNYPRRPSPMKCFSCDFRQLCEQTPQEFSGGTPPPPIHVPGGELMVGAFSDYQIRL
ncbi:MAG: ATP-dependent DNA helicase [Dehalogenimonas sp.]